MCVYSMAGNLHEKANNTFSASCPLWSGKKRFVVAARPRQKNLSENVAFVVDPSMRRCASGSFEAC